LSEKTLSTPEKFTLAAANKSALINCVDTSLKDVVVDLNAEVDQMGEDFDYRGKLRDEVWVKGLASRIMAEYQKLVLRSRIDSL
jgi:hypothetical protein